MSKVIFDDEGKKDLAHFFCFLFLGTICVIGLGGWVYTSGLQAKEALVGLLQLFPLVSSRERTGANGC